MKKFVVKNKIILLISIFIILVMISMFLVFKYINQKNKIMELNTDNYSIQYDSTWTITQSNELEINLLHKKSQSEINVKINELQDDNQYRTIDEIYDSLLYNIQVQNPDYKLIYKEEAKITKQNIEGYKILFEANDRQALICLYKQGNKLIVFTYEAFYEYFDILLDSVNNIIYNFSTIEEKFDVKTSINLETSEIHYTEQSNISNMLENTIETEIASSNYLVKYSIPSNFKATSYNTQFGYYDFQNVPKDTQIKLSTSILQSNLYKYLDKEESTNIYNNYKINSENRANGELNKFGDEPLSYIYKNSYMENNIIIENITMVFELNQNHIFKVEISSRGIGIPEELVKMVKINDFKNIASTISINKENGFLIGKLKQYAENTHNQTEEITLKLPEYYQEIDNNTNLYEERVYISNYYEETQIPIYQVNYKIITYNIDVFLNNLDEMVDKNLGEYNDFVQKDDITINNKNFKFYERGYTSQNTDINSNEKQKYYTNEKILFYQLQNNNYMAIIIKANEIDKDNKITDELMSELTNFDINIK